MTALRLCSALLRRGAAPRALSRLAVHACGQSVAHREVDLTAPHADVLQHTIVEPLERTNGAALASFGSQVSRHLPAPQDEHAQPFCGRAHGGARAGRNDDIAFNRGEPLEFEGRNRRAGIVFHGHGLLLHGPVASMRASRRGGSTPRRAAGESGRLAGSGPAGLKEGFAQAGIFLEIFCRCSKITPYQGEFPQMSEQNPDRPQDEGGANINACASLAASSMVMNTAPAAAKSFSSPSSASMR